MILRRALVMLLLASTAATSGCTSLGIPHLWGEKVVVADARHPVMEVMCLWEAAEGTGLDGLPCRGFAGQILFFTAGQSAPAKVDGDIRVFVFDDEGVQGDKAAPIHQFDFPSEAWNVFLTTTNFGTAYQLFIPYTKLGNRHAECQLRVRFTPKGGNPVFSKPCTVTLVGPRDAKQVAGQRSGGGNPPVNTTRTRQPILQASYEEPVARMAPPTEIQVAPSSAAIDARNARVQRLNRMATAMMDDAQASAASKEAPDASPAPPLRQRLHPLSGNILSEEGSSPAATPQGPADAAPAATAQHLLLD